MTNIEKGFVHADMEINAWLGGENVREGSESNDYARGIDRKLNREVAEYRKKFLKNFPVGSKVLFSDLIMPKTHQEAYQDGDPKFLRLIDEPGVIIELCPDRYSEKNYVKVKADNRGWVCLVDVEEVKVIKTY